MEKRRNSCARYGLALFLAVFGPEKRTNKSKFREGFPRRRDGFPRSAPLAKSSRRKRVALERAEEAEERRERLTERRAGGGWEPGAAVRCDVGVVA